MIIVTGTIAYDYIMDFPGKFADHILPDQIHNINLSFIVNQFAKRRGGTAGNVSYTMGLLGTPHILYTIAGKDFTEYKQAFEKLGIATNHVTIDTKAYTSTGFAMTDKTNNQIWGYFYGASDGIPQLSLKKIAKKGDLVLVGPSGASGSLSFVRQCVALGISYMFDPGFILTQVSDEDLTFATRHATYVIGNDYEMQLVRKRTKLASSVFAEKIVITTRGDKGATIEQGKRTMDIKPVVAKQIVDPSGAGDAWRGGFLVGLEKGFDLVVCGQMGAVAATYTVEQYGTQEQYFTKKEFINRYRQTFQNTLSL